MNLQSNSNPAKEDKLNSESLDPLVQGFPKEEGHLCTLPDITKKDPLLRKVVTGTQMDSMLYVFSYSSSPPFIMKPAFMILYSPYMFTSFTGILLKILRIGQRFACIIWSKGQGKLQLCGVSLNLFFIILTLKTNGLLKKELHVAF